MSVHEPDKFEPVKYQTESNNPDKRSKSSGLPTGPFHPTVLGNCMYALGILDTISPETAAFIEGGALIHTDGGSIKPKLGDGWEKTAIRRLCSAETFGYEAKKK